MTIVRPPSTLGHADYFAGYLLYVVFFGAALFGNRVKARYGKLWEPPPLLPDRPLSCSAERAALCSGWPPAQYRSGSGTVPGLRWRHAIVAAGLCAVGLVFYFLASRIEASRSLALGARRPARRRETLALARLATHGQPAPAHWFWPRDVRTGIPSIPIRGALAGVSGFLPRVAAQHFSGRLGVGGHPRTGDSKWIRGAGVVRRSTRPHTRTTGRAVSRFSAGSGAHRRSVRMLHSTRRSLLLCDRRDAGGPGNSAPKTVLTTDARAALGLRVPALAVTVMAVTMFLYFIVRLTASDLALWSKRSAIWTPDTSKNRWRLTYGRNDGIQLAPSDDLYFSRVLLAASRNASNPARARMEFQQAFIIARRAAKTSEEQQNAWYNLAWFYAAQNDAAGMEACLRRSVDASPNWFKSHWALAQMLLFVRPADGSANRGGSRGRAGWRQGSGNCKVFYKVFTITRRRPRQNRGVGNESL